jgi:hypothetical protein
MQGLLSASKLLSCAREMMPMKKSSRISAPVKNQGDKGICITPDQIGEGWEPMIPENLKLSEERKYRYREVKGFSLQNLGMTKMAQLLVVLFEFEDDGTAKEAFAEVAKGLETEMPKNPGVGDESTLYEMDMQPIVKMRIAAFRKGTWLVIFTVWQFQGYDTDDQWMRSIMESQLNKIGDR